LPKNTKTMSLAFYLKVNGRNVDPSARITLPKTDWRSDPWIFVDRDFSTKENSHFPYPMSHGSDGLMKKETLPLFSLFFFLLSAPHAVYFFSFFLFYLFIFFFFFSFRRATRPFLFSGGAQVLRPAPHHFIIYIYIYNLIN
jgi:hypothetical protein